MAVSGVRRRAAQLLAATGLGIALPLFDRLGDEPAFFAARGSPARDVVLFTLAVVAVPPLALLLVELAAGAADTRVADRLHSVLVAALVGLFALWGLERLGLESTLALLLLAAAAALAAGLLVAGSRVAGTLLAVLAPAPFVAAGLLLLATPVSELALPTDTNVDVAAARSSTPVVVVLLSELPTVSLLTPAGEIDEGRFPAFASLARSSTWFRNATTVSTSTDEAVPALLSGKRPDGDRLPIFQNHRQNLFTLLGDDYRMNVRETQTRLCPPSLCERPPEPGGTGLRSLLADGAATYLRVVAPPGLENRLPRPDADRATFGDTGTFDAEREREFRAFLRSLRFEEGEDPALDLVHLRLPQGPWTRFPDGSESALVPEAPRRRDEATTTQAWQRHLLQAGYADRLLGRLVERMREVGLWERALLAVVADRGIAFRPDAAPDAVNADTLGEVAFVPLLLKLPGQSTGRIEERHVTSVDVLPTIADALTVSVPWETDGVSGLTRGRGAEDVRVDGVSTPIGAAVGARQTALARRVELLGWGAWDERLYGPGRARAVVGRTIGEFAVADDVDGEAVVPARPAELLRELPKGEAVVPSPVTGVLTGGVRPGDTLAVAVNGVVQALCTAYEADGATRFSALVPPESFNRGERNEVRVFVYGGTAAEPSLAEIPTRPER